MQDTILLTTADSTGPTAPLVEQVGVHTVQDFEYLLTWNGRQCYYSGFSTYWSISSQLQLNDPVKRSLAQWQEHWQVDVPTSTFWSQVFWKRLPESRPAHTHTLSDYALDENAANNSPVRGATDAYDAGFIASQLPLLPPEPGSDQE
jgi:hypothetical protein